MVTLLGLESCKEMSLNQGNSLFKKELGWTNTLFTIVSFTYITNAHPKSDENFRNICEIGLSYHWLFKAAASLQIDYAMP